MSQRKWMTEDGTREVLVGWDRPLQNFFVTVFAMNKGEDVEYSSMDDPEWDFNERRAQAVIDKLTALGVPFPTTLLADLSQDQKMNAGNVVQFYGKEG